ncbi:ADP-ribosylglycohydrolase family protein [Streptomyces sp. TLI_146]|uniref:ADP-ribosylglycohydrolase family protein n=1 Tax=Streptomyces sp. TLI_146 TaxID=1938858 RepID=UPI000C707B12|nr:ADP-ribosylglycohydrolase family protein [Streptomyces sp. TLI_146]PKV85229.1 ADP-ribosylglycohydrolase [Streptomyces sp. TLI_146]
MTPLRVTWVQPEDLLTHELRQAAEDGREAGRIASRWKAAGGTTTPVPGGASMPPAPPALRALAIRLLDELAEQPSRLAPGEPTDLAAIKAATPSWPGTESEAPHQGRGGAGDIPRLHAAWLGRAAGCLLGKPVEKLPLHGIREIARATGNWPLHTWFTATGLPADLVTRYPWNRRSAPTSLAENIDGMPEDDDLNYPLLGLLLLQRHGRHFTTTQVAQLWLDELPAGRTFTAERVAYRNLLDGIEPPHTATHRNPFREWIGAAIRADVHGWTNPGDPAAAAEQAHRDAVLTHTANGVYGAMFTAAAISLAATGAYDVHGCLAGGLAVIPPRSRLAEAVRLGIRLAHEESDFDTVVDHLHTALGGYHWVHSVPNAALLAAALTHADGDFSGSICRAVSGGWDTDSNGATAGSLAGLLAGHPEALPARWTAPLKNRLASTVADFDGTGFDTLAQLTARLTPPLIPQEVRSA